MTATDFDLLVIGFGKAGKTIAMERAKAGEKVALIERSPDMYGGTCINIGCVPTKTLIHATTDGLSWSDAVRTRDELIEALNSTNYQLADDAGVTVIDAEARFSGEREVTVSAPSSEEVTLTATRVVINTGAVTNVPPIDGVDGPNVYDSTTIQHVSPRPERLVIVGNGPIGLEFASMFALQGSLVSVIGSSEPFKLYDERVATESRRILESQGVQFLSGRVSALGEHSVTYGEDQQVEADAILLATGRTPATEGLNLEAAGVEVGEKGEVLVDASLRTSAEGVWAVGDVNGGPQQTYISYDDYRVLASQFDGDGSYTTEGRIFPTTTFITPPLSHIGLTEREAKEQGREVKVSSSPVADMPIVPRPKTLGHPEGIAQFVVDAESDEILGATLLVVDSQELINTVAIAMRYGITASELGAGIYTHPSTSELFNQLL